MPVLQFDEKFRQCFWDLASVKEAIREKATNELLSILKKEQEKSPNDPKQLTYALTRLIRGLSSSRDGARQGFSVALTHVLRAFPSIQTSSYIQKVGEILPKNSNTKGKEEREIFYGRIFSILVLARAARFVENDEIASMEKDDSDSSDEEMDDDTAENKEEIQESEESGEAESDDSESEELSGEEDYNNPLDWAVSNLHELSKRKEQFEQLCYFTTVEIFRQLTSSNVHQILEKVHSTFFPAKQTNFTASQIYFLCVLEREFKWKHPSGSVLTEVALRNYSEALVGTFSTHPEIHIVWKEILQFCFPEEEFSDIPPPKSLFPNTSNKKTKNTDYFDVLWADVIEGKLFQSESHQKKHLGFQITEHIIPLLPENRIATLFTPCFSRCIINSLHSSQNFLHGAVSHLLQNIIKKSEDMTSKAKLSLIRELLKLNRNFDGFSKSKVVEILVSRLELGEIEEYLTDLTTQFYNIEIDPEAELDEEQSKAVIDSQRIRALNRMLSLCRTVKNKDESFLCSVLHFYLLHGFFEMKEGSKLTPPKKSILSLEQWSFLQVPIVPVSEKVIHQCRTVLTSLFKEFATLSLNNGVPGEMKSGEVWPSYALRVYADFQAHPNTTEISPLSEPATEALSSLQKMAVTINKAIAKYQKNEKTAKNEKEQAKIHTQLKIQFAYRLLTLNCAILLYFESDSDIVEAMEDLRGSYSHLTQNNDEDGPNPYDVVTDIIISLLTRSSAYLRTVANRSFSLLSDTLPSSSVKILVDSIDPSVGAFDEYEDDEFSDDDMEDDEGVPFSLEEAEASNSANAMDEGSDDSDSDSEDDSDEENGTGVIDEELEKELQRLQEDNGEQEDIYIEDAPIEDLKKFNDRLQMMLANMKKHARESDEKRTMQIDHKMKILDLLETFLHHQPSNPIAFSFLIPLFKAIISAETNKSQVNYLVKLRHFAIHKFLKISKLSATEPEHVSQLIEFYKQIAPLCIGSKKVSPATVTCAHDFIFYIVKLLVLKDSHRDVIVAALRKSFVESTEKPLKHFDWVLWTKLVQKYGNSISPLVEDILQAFVVSTVKPFALAKALELIDIFCKLHWQSLQESKEFIQSIKLFFKQVPDIIARKDTNVQHLVAMLSAIHSALQLLQKSGKTKMKQMTEFISVLETLQSSSNSQKIKTRCGNCLRILTSSTGKRKRSSGANSSAKKQKSTTAQTDVSQVTPKKPKKSNKDKRSENDSNKQNEEKKNTPKKSKRHSTGKNTPKNKQTKTKDTPQKSKRTSTGSAKSPKKKVSK